MHNPLGIDALEMTAMQRTENTVATQPTSIFLIGMMASGKSTIGRALARTLGWPFFDVDREIEKRSGVAISTIFDMEGEAGFRTRESQMMAELTEKPGVVVAMGGGAPMFEVNQTLLKRGFVIELRSSVSDILERTRRDTSRPLLQTEDRERRIRDLLQERGPVYASVADVFVITTRTNPERVVERILAIPEVADIRARVEVQKQEGKA